MNGRRVLDASVALAWLLPDEAEPPYPELLAAAAGNPPLVPSLWLYETANALRTAVRRKRHDSRTADEALDLLAAIPVQTVALGWLEMREAYRLAGEHDVSVYDASYLVVARHFNAKIASLDDGLRRAAKKLKLA